MEDIDPKLLDTAETVGMTTSQQIELVRGILECTHKAYKLANSLMPLVPRDDTPAPYNGKLITALEEISEIGRILNTKSRELINNSEEQ